MAFFRHFQALENIFNKAAAFLKTLGVEDVIGKVFDNDEWKDIVTGIGILGASQAGTRALKEGETRAKVIENHRVYWKNNKCSLPTAIDEYLKKASA